MERSIGRYERASVGRFIEMRPFDGHLRHGYAHALKPAKNLDVVRPVLHFNLSKNFFGDVSSIDLESTVEIASADLKKKTA